MLIPLPYTNCCFKPVPYSAAEVDCAGGPVILVLHDVDQVGADVVCPQGWPYSCVPNPIKGLFKIHEELV